MAAYHPEPEAHRPPGGSTSPQVHAHRTKLVFRGVLRGESQQELAERLGISMRSVRRYRARVRKLYPLLLDTQVLRSELGRTLLKLQDAENEINETIAHLPASAKTLPALIGERTKLWQLQAAIAEKLGAFDHVGPAGSGPGDDVMRRLREVPDEELRGQEIAAIVEMERETAGGYAARKDGER